MPRDVDLIRDLILRFEQNGTSVPPGRSQQEVAYHVKQLIDEGFVEGRVVMKPSPGKLLPHSFFINDITWKGHDFSKAVRDESVWCRTKDHFRERSVPWTVDLVLEFLKSGGRAALGL